MDDATVVLSFFSPANYELPKRHLHAVVNTMHAQGIRVVVTQAVLPNQIPQQIPLAITQAALPTQSFLFHKERLWNIGAKLTNSKYIFFLDADIVFKTCAWLEISCGLLERADIVQPFSRAVWLDHKGEPDMYRPSSAVAISSNGVPNLSRYHPGFGWGMTRNAYNALGGFYDASVAGNSDSLFALSLRDNCVHSALEKWFSNRQDTSVNCETYQSYKKNAVGLDLKVDAPDDIDAVHLWHGFRKDRQYVTRTPMFPRLPNGEFAVHDATNGLQEWDDIDAANNSTFKYFKEKRDDG